jgi:DNA primase
MLEIVDRVGPYSAKVKIDKINDVRAEKRKRIVERAKTILYDWEIKKIPIEDEVLREVEEALIKAKIIEYGPEKLPAGPEVEENEELIIVEGRADVINLLRHGYKNVIAVEGVRIPETIKEIVKTKKKVIAFLDGDRGGDLILKQLLNEGIKIDFIVRAPYGKEVEELTGKEIADAFEEAKSIKEEKYKSIILEKKQFDLPNNVLEIAKEVEGSLMAYLMDNEANIIEKVPVSELAKKIEDYKNIKYIVFDGVITQRLVDIASTINEEIYLIGSRIGEITKKPINIQMLVFQDLFKK